MGKTQVTNLERELVFSVADGCQEAFIHIGMIRDLSQKTQDVDYLGILAYLKREKIIGPDFIRMLKARSYLNFVADIRRRMHNDYKKRKIYARGGIYG